MKKNELIFLSILLIIAASLGFASLTSGHNWAYSDFASYIMQAKSILAGDMHAFITQNTITILESDLPVGPIAYPWGYPLMLAPVIALMGISTLSMKLLNILFFLAFLLTLHFLARRRLPQFESFALVAFFAFNPVLLSAQDNTLSDIPFLALSTFAIFLMDDRDAVPAERTFLKQALIGAAIFAAFLTRTNGLLLLPSLIAYEIFFTIKRRESTFSISRWWGSLITFLVLWGVFSLIFPGGQFSHLEHYQNFDFAQVLLFTRAYIKLGRDFFAAAPLATFFYTLFGISFITGFLYKFKENLLFSLYFFSTMLLYISWPHLQGVRFLFPILPFFLYIGLQGMQVIVSKLSGKLAITFRLASRASFIFIAATMFFSSFQYARQNLADGRVVHGPFDDVAIELFDYIDLQTPEDSRITFFKPRVMTLMTGRDSILVLSCESLAKADYAVINLKWEDMGQIAPEEISSCPIELIEEYKNRRFVVYKIGD